MTVIAWDGKTLAADKQSSYGSLPAITTKVFRIRNHLVAGSGDTARIIEMRKWFEDGADPAKLPAFQTDEAKFVDLMVVDPAGGLMVYSNGPLPSFIQNQFWATGSGRDFAIAAMHCGKTAREAVEIASLFCTGCGQGVDSLELE